MATINHPGVGIFAASALVGHSVMDGFAIGAAPGERAVVPVCSLGTPPPARQLVELLSWSAAQFDHVQTRPTCCPHGRPEGGRPACNNRPAAERTCNTIRGDLAGSHAAGSRLGPVRSGVPGGDRRAGARSLLWLGEAVECRSHHGRGCGSEDGAEHHIADSARRCGPASRPPHPQATGSAGPAPAGAGRRRRRTRTPTRHAQRETRSIPASGPGGPGTARVRRDPDAASWQGASRRG
jgi:hypothetical protein